MAYGQGVLINEWMKRKERIYWILSIYVIFAVVLLVTEWFFVYPIPMDLQAADWQTQLQMQFNQLNQYYQTLQTDDPVYRQVSGQITIMQHQLDMGIQPEPEGAIHWLNTDISGMSIKYIIPLFIIVIGGDIFSAETSSGTMKLLLLSPMGRVRLLFAKLVSVFIISSLIMLLMNMVTFFIGFIRDGKLGFSDDYVMLDASGFPFIMESWEFTLLGICLNLLSVLTVACVIVFISLLLSVSPSFSVLASFIVVTVIDSFLSIIKNFASFVQYYPMFHLDLNAHFTGNFSGEASLTTSILLLLMTSVICVGGSLWRIKTRDFA